MKPGDLFATLPDRWYEKWICRILKAHTWHWGMIIKKDADGWIITESLAKGVALTRLDYPDYYIYHIKGLKRVSPNKLISVISHYGACPYDWDVYFHTAIWWLAKHYFGKLLPRHHDKEFHCQEWVCLLASELGARIIPDDEYPMCVNLERSPYLEEQDA